MKYRIRDHHKRDFWCYVWFNRLCNRGTQYFCPDPSELKIRGTDHTISCFVGLEAVGECGNPKHPRLLKLALDGKKLLNFHIKLWAEGITDGIILPYQIQELLFRLPDWVCEALDHQVYRLRERRLNTTQELGVEKLPMIS